jgi:uncharacterized protein DUF932
MSQKTFFSDFNFDVTAIENELKKMAIFQNEGGVRTFYNDTIISETQVSDKYQVFDFPKFCLDVIPTVTKAFTPEKAILRINKGVQELRLVGETFLLDGEEFKKQLNIVSSTNKSKALQINIGLWRKVCSNGMFASVDGASTGFKVKHFKSTLNAKLEAFLKRLPEFNDFIDEQKAVLLKLNAENTTFNTIVKKLAVNKDGKVVPSNLLKVRSFSRKLTKSDTDKIVGLTKGQENLLKNPVTALDITNETDVEMTKMRALNCWTEVFRNCDSPTIKRETKRILTAMS